MAEPRRYLCSQLVSLKAGETEVWANLEEIWPEGAVLECEDAVPNDIHAELREHSALLAGRIVSVEKHEFGWRVELEFSPLTPWSLALFRPEHLLALND